ncbi:hypothetical protein NUW54_g11681 [Trametes sanguinea]|uniref:Uncharacterized protein n=1 Tax=Trametes sanguinea TaxID=158606 RepID=A0ACC1N8V1_9APHY|nr:hypothetical protein NUW54_g11681 [Trametes sanguinea]
MRCLTRYLPSRDCAEDGAWHTWKLQNGQTSAIRGHLKKYHSLEWRSAVINNRLKGWEQLASGSSGPGAQDAGDSQHPMHASFSTEPFLLSTFKKYIADWIAYDDQAIQVVDSEPFRRMLTYASMAPRHLSDRDIPHRTHIHNLLVREYQEEIENIRRELTNALGRVSFTCDLWSCNSLRGFLAITVHYCSEGEEKQLKLETRLGAFCYIPGRHTGANLAQHFMQVLEELNVLDRKLTLPGGPPQLGCITLDNASNCGTMMADLARLLQEKNIAFDAEGNRLRCFPHVVNICVKRGLAALTDPEPNPSTGENLDIPLLSTATSQGSQSERTVPQAPGHDPPSLAPVDRTAEAESNTTLMEDPEYAESLRDDPVKSARDLVKACRASGQRREDFAATIADGNRTGTFGEGKTLRQVQLLRDVDTRWSSTFLMIDRLLELYPAVETFMNDPKQMDIAHYLLGATDLRVLEDIREFLLLPHLVQELLSAEQTPTASQALPAYERLLGLLKLAAKKHPKIAHGINASISALEQYMAYTRQTRVYALAMIVNPSMKLAFLDKHWTAEEKAAAIEWAKEAVSDQKLMPVARLESSELNTPSLADVGASQGFARASCQC